MTGYQVNRLTILKVHLSDVGKWYVDDKFCLFRHREHVDKFLEHINNFHPNNKFTVEVEEDNNFPFLDVLVTHEQTGFSTSLYRKHLLDFILTMLALPPTNVRST